MKIPATRLPYLCGESIQMNTAAFKDDLLGELCQDTHGLWEWFAYVKLHYPNSSDQEALQAGTDLLVDWFDDDWIKISEKPLYPSDVTNRKMLFDLISQKKTQTLLYFENAPSLDITEEGKRIYLELCGQQPDGGDETTPIQ